MNNKLKKQIADVIYENLESIYCSICRNDGDKDTCEYCRKKTPQWGISKKFANELAEKIIEEIEDEIEMDDDDDDECLISF
jgi:hypothetical protein